MHREYALSRVNQLIARKETGSRLSSVELSLIVGVIIAPDPTQLNQLSCVELSRIGRYDQGVTHHNLSWRPRWNDPDSAGILAKFWYVQKLDGATVTLTALWYVSPFGHITRLWRTGGQAMDKHFDNDG